MHRCSQMTGMRAATDLRAEVLEQQRGAVTHAILGQGLVCRQRDAARRIGGGLRGEPLPGCVVLGLRLGKGPLQVLNGGLRELDSTVWGWRRLYMRQGARCAGVQSARQGRATRLVLQREAALHKRPPGS